VSGDPLNGGPPGTDPADLRDRGSVWRDGLAPAVAGWLGARVAVAFGYLLARLLSGSVDLPDGRLHLDEGLMTYDGTFYRLIAQGWYDNPALPEEGIRFFPGYPGLARVLSPLTLGNEDLALLLVANASAIAAGALLWRLAVEVTGDRGTGVRAAWMVAVIPAANVFAFAYTESVMLLLVTAFLLALHRRALGWAAGMGLLAGLLRPAGVILVVPAAIEAWRWWISRRSSTADGPQHRRPAAAELLGWSATLVSSAVGLLAAMWIVSRRTGDISDAFTIQRQLRDGFRDPVTRLAGAVVDFAGGSLHDVYNVAFAVGFAVLFVVAVRRRQPVSWLALMAATWLVAASANNIDSFGRYCVVASPFVIALAQWARSIRWQVVVASVGLAGTLWYTTEVFLGRVIP
jgi:hypothetical protein